MSTPNDDLASKIGVDKLTSNQAYDGAHGSYDDPVPAMPVEKRLTVLPMVDDPSPFSLGSVPTK